MNMRFSPQWARAGTALRRFRPRSGAGSQSREISEVSAKSAFDGPIRAGGAVLDLAEGRVTAPDGTVTELRRQSADVLRVLADRAGHTVSKADLLDAVWGDIAVTEDSLVQCVAEVRRALGTARDRLHTAHRSGYRLDLDASPEAPVRTHRRLLTVCAGGLCAGLVALALWQRLQTPVGPPDFDGPVVAVLPFENLAGGERWDRLARGVTEEVIADLATIPWIFVLADATTRPHAGEPPRALGDALGVGHVVTGTIQTEGDHVRIAATLADASSGRQVWTRNWDGPTGDLLALQTAAAEALTGELAGRYSGAIVQSDRARAHRQKTDSLAAYELYLIGIEHKHRFTPADYDIAEGYLKRATDIDPGFAKAWVGLSLVEGFRAGLATDPAAVEASTQRARVYVERAVAADPDDPGVLIERSKFDAIAGDFETAGRALRRAVELAPNDADTLAVAAWSAGGRAAIGRDAVTWTERAEALNPNRPDWYMGAKGTAAFAAGEYALAVDALNASPRSWAERWVFLAAAEAMLGHDDAARAAAAEVRRQIPSFDLAVYLESWWEPEAVERLRDGLTGAGLGATQAASNG
jgi:TolB-like protein/DNA-binding winged helix-turn-helix (wHTH) protein